MHLLHRRSAPTGTLRSILSCAFLALAPAFAATAQEPGAASAAAQARALGEQVVVARVVDGDTIHVDRGGEVEKLRLLSVDTEEKFAPGGAGSPTKPQTVFGEETALWARELFAGLAGEDGRTRVRLVFPGGREARDVYGRLLCHVVLPDGEDYNLRLVREGRSPYFNKYGNSLLLHERFVAAQEAARAAGRGIWNPNTNRPEDPSAPAAVRPYARLLPWWDCRAQAIDGFRARHAAAPLAVVDAEDPAQLAAAVAAGLDEVTVFGTPDRFFDERDGSWTVLFRSADRQRAFRARVPADRREAHAALELERLTEEFRQNYVYVRGALTWSGRSYELRSTSPEQWRRAGPEPGTGTGAETEPR